MNHIQNEIQIGSINDYSIYKRRRAAYRTTRKDAGVLHQRATPITTAYNRRGYWIPGKHYNFGDVQILWHPVGYLEYGILRHFNSLFLLKGE
ncbi:MAG: hypothetical protein NC090_07110 [Anaeroplasma bactoclasticum]|nr:hypothetical protein [Anaeroplasma bactoclasticum]